jgi:hypothetical protein
MPAEVQFLANNRVALFKYRSPLTVNELTGVFDRFCSACSQASEPIHSIGDVSEISSLPSNILSLLRNGKNSPLHQSMAGVFVIVTRNSFIRAMVSASARLMPGTKIQAVETMDEAWAVIESTFAAEGSGSLRVKESIEAT